MEKTLALIVAAAVLMMTAVIVIFMTSGSLTGVSNNTDNLEKDSVCSFQINQAQKSGDWSRLDPACADRAPEDENVQDEIIRASVASRIT